MTYTIKELAELAGVSTRTLRWYDKIGLLTPTGTTEAKYRLYDETSVARLQQILFYRELEFSLAEIGRSNDAFQSLDQKSYDRRMEIEAEIFKLLKTAVLTGAAPQGPAGKKIARLHRDWCFFGQESYHAGKHAKIAELYVSDERFTVYYDSEVKGCAKFLRDAVAAYAEEQESV